MFFLAEQLNKHVSEIAALDNHTFMMWEIYFARKAQKKELAQKMERNGQHR